MSSSGGTLLAWWGNWDCERPWSLFQTFQNLQLRFFKLDHQKKQNKRQWTGIGQCLSDTIRPWFFWDDDPKIFGYGSKLSTPKMDGFPTEHDHFCGSFGPISHWAIAISSHETTIFLWVSYGFSYRWCIHWAGGYEDDHGRGPGAELDRYDRKD